MGELTHRRPERNPDIKRVTCCERVRLSVRRWRPLIAITLRDAEFMFVYLSSVQRARLVVGFLEVN